MTGCMHLIKKNHVDDVPVASQLVPGGTRLLQNLIEDLLLLPAQVIDFNARAVTSKLAIGAGKTRTSLLFEIACCSADAAYSHVRPTCR